MKDVREALLGLSSDTEGRATFITIVDWFDRLDSDDAPCALTWLNSLSKVELKNFASLSPDQKTLFFRAHQPPKNRLTEDFNNGRRWVEENKGLIKRINAWCAAFLAREPKIDFSMLNPFKW